MAVNIRKGPLLTFGSLLKEYHYWKNKIFFRCNAYYFLMKTFNHSHSLISTAMNFFKYYLFYPKIKISYPARHYIFSLVNYLNLQAIFR